MCLQSPPRSRRAKERGRANTASQQTKRNRKHGLWRNFKELSRTRQVELCFLGLVAMGGIGYLIAYICISVSQSHQARWNYKAEHRARLIFSRPPELLGTLECEITGQEMHIHAGQMHVWVKNIKKGDASGAYIVGPSPRFVPEKKTGNPELDEPPPPSITDGTCTETPMAQMKEFPVNADQEVVVNIAQTAATWHFGPGKTKTATITFDVPPKQGDVKGLLAKDTIFQISAPTCVYYFDESGEQHGTCVTYKLSSRGQAGFSCMESPISGIVFEQAISAYCQN